MEKREDKTVDIKTGEIELPKLDITPYIGKKAKIASAVVKEGQYGYYVKVETLKLDTIGKGEKAFDLKASKIFGLHQDDEGRVGWGAETKLGIFMNKMKAKQLKDLVGKEVIVQSQTSDSGVDFLSFN